MVEKAIDMGEIVDEFKPIGILVDTPKYRVWLAETRNTSRIELADNDRFIKDEHKGHWCKIYIRKKKRQRPQDDFPRIFNNVFGLILLD